MIKYILASLFSVVLSVAVLSQDTIRIDIITDVDDEGSILYGLINSIKTEVSTLTKFEYQVSFKTKGSGYDIDVLNKSFDDAYANLESDIIIAVGSLASAVLAQRKVFPKPSIATVIIDNELQQIPLTDSATSGVDNFTYLQTPFNIKRDLQTLHRIAPFKKLGVIGAPDFANYLPFINELMNKFMEDLGATAVNIPLDTNVTAIIDGLPTDIDALYILPLFDDLDTAGLIQLFKKINEKKIPSSALIGDDYVVAGALIGYEAIPNLQKMPRRVAINITKILEGKNARDLPVNIPTYTDHIIVNMASARTSGIFPDWNLMNEAILLNFNEVATDTVFNLETIIIEVLQHNLGFLAKQKDPRIASKEVDIARSELLPQLDGSTSLSLIDAARSENSFGTQGRSNWLASGSLSQLILAEPAVANVAIQELLQKASEKELEQAYLDIILDAAKAYLNILQAESFLKIALQNEALNRNNFDISKAKEAVGYTGASDLNRWRTELALASIDVNDANAQLQQARLFLNQLLNLDLGNHLNLERTTLQDQVVLVTDPKILQLIENPGDLAIFADFLVEEALRNAPELSQLDYGIAAQERLKLSQQRSFYLPSVAISGQWDYTLKKWNVTETPGVPIRENLPSWSLGIGVKYPILQGQKRKHNLEQTNLNILQLQDQRGDFKTQIALQVRSDLQEAGASFSRVNLFQEAANAARDNYNIIQDSYAQGAVNVTSLIDAQNAALQTELSAENAVYQFIINFLTLERSSGKIYFLAPEADRRAFLERLDLYISQRKIDN